MTDVDGNVEEPRAARSPCSTARRRRSACSTTEEEEIEAVGAGSRSWSSDGVVPHEIGVFVRSEAEIGARAGGRRSSAGLPFTVLDEHVETDQRRMSRSARCIWPRAWSSAPSS